MYSFSIVPVFFHLNAFISLLLIFIISLLVFLRRGDSFLVFSRPVKRELKAKQTSMTFSHGRHCNLQPKPPSVSTIVSGGRGNNERGISSTPSQHASGPLLVFLTFPVGKKKPLKLIFSVTPQVYNFIQMIHIVFSDILRCHYNM